jgi:Polysaccharide pyruvyl transferase.
LKSFISKYKLNKQLFLLDEPIFIDGFPESANFGDALNIFLARYLSGRNVFPARFLDQTYQRFKPSYAVIGSICQWSRQQTIVWGAGFIEDKLNTVDFVKPNQVLAVRGPLSRNVYLANGIECPPCYGDPALLLPLIYNPQVEPVYTYGIIPHYVDWDMKWVNQYRTNKDVSIINIMIGDNYELFVKQLKSCRKIVTSSLHGLILAHAYGIPVCSIKLSNNITGGEFKFTDYLLSVGKVAKERINLAESEISIERLCYDDQPIDVNLAPLIEACPFILPDQKRFLLSKNRSYYQSPS